MHNSHTWIIVPCSGTWSPYHLPKAAQPLTFYPLPILSSLESLPVSQSVLFAYVFSPSRQGLILNRAWLQVGTQYTLSLNPCPGIDDRPLSPPLTYPCSWSRHGVFPSLIKAHLLDVILKWWMWLTGLFLNFHLEFPSSVIWGPRPQTLGTTQGAPSSLRCCPRVCAEMWSSRDWAQM